MTMNATRTTLRQALPRWQRGIVRAVLLMGALAGMSLVSTTHAQIAFRSASSAFITGGGTPVAPTLRSTSTSVLTPGTTRFYLSQVAADVDPTIRGSWPDGGTTCCGVLGTAGTKYVPLKLSRTKPWNAAKYVNITRSVTSVNPGRVLIMK